MTDTHQLAFEAKPTGNLFGRPTFLQLGDHRYSQVFQPNQLAPPGTTRGGCSLRIQAVVAVQLRQLHIDKSIALDLAIDARAMPAQMCRDLSHRHLRVQHVFNRTPFTQIQLCVGHVPFSLLFSKIGDLSQRSLECAPVHLLLQPSRNVTGSAKQECHHERRR